MGACRLVACDVLCYGEARCGGGLVLLRVPYKRHIVRGYWVISRFY